MTEVELKKEQLAKAVKFGLLGLFCAVVAPVAWMAVTGIAGMLVAVGVGIVGWNVAPVLALKAANMKYRAIDAEKVDHIKKVQQAATENPIETLRLEYTAREKDLKVKETGITEYRTGMKDYKGKRDDFAKRYPQEANMWDEQFNAMKENLATREAKYSKAQSELVQFGETIEKFDAMWKMGQATQKMNALGGGNADDDMTRIKLQAAVDSVRSSMNKAFAEMETESMVNRGSAQPALMNDPQPVLVIDNATQKVMV